MPRVLLHLLRIDFMGFNRIINHRMTSHQSQITGTTIVCSTACSGWQQRNYQSPSLLVLCDGNPQVTGGFSCKVNNKAESGSLSCLHSLYASQDVLPQGELIIWSSLFNTYRPSPYHSVKTRSMSWLLMLLLLLFVLYDLLWFEQFEQNNAIPLLISFRVSSLALGAIVFVANEITQGPLLLTWFNFNLSMDK